MPGGRNAGKESSERLGGAVLDQIPFLQHCEDEDSDEEEDGEGLPLQAPRQHKKQRVKAGPGVGRGDARVPLSSPPFLPALGREHSMWGGEMLRAKGPCPTLFPCLSFPSRVKGLRRAAVVWL